MTDSRDALDHATHDTFLIASLATRDPDLADPAIAAARSQVEACSACAALHADLVAIAAATPTSAMPTRPRDFRLTDADVARLAPSGWRRFLHTIGSPRDAITKPLALGFTTLGIAGLIAASLPGAFLGAGAASVDSALPNVGGQIEQAPSEPAAPAAAASAEALYQSDEPKASNGDTSNAFDGAGEAANEDNGRASGAADPDGLAIRDDASGLSALAVIAGSLLIVGLGIFLLRWSARRFGD